jgi:uncharacterized LabA/DUF88 family protein
MRGESRKLLKKIKDKKVGIFCDDSNLYHSYDKQNWRIDFRKFKRFIKGICKLEFINYYIAIPAKNDVSYLGTQRFLKKIQPYVSVKDKKLKYISAGEKIIKKGDVDVEIVLDVIRNIEKIDVFIILSGDSDLLELKNYIFKEKKKKIIFWAFEKHMAWELKKYCWHLYLNDYKKEISAK